MTRDHAERIAIDVLGFLATDPVRLQRFLALSGLEAGHLREAAQEPAFLAGILAHVAGDERTVVDFCEASGHPTEAPGEALKALGGGNSWGSV